MGGRSSSFVERRSCLSLPRQCACISKGAGGIGLSVHKIRARGSYIRGTKGISNGLVPMLRVFDATARCVASSHAAVGEDPCLSHGRGSRRGPCSFDGARQPAGC